MPNPPDQLSDQLQASLSGHYTIERELGGGGMSRVFLADETRFGRRVVIKILTHEVAAGLSAERFEREIKLAAQLQQANIVPVIGAGEIAPRDASGALPYYTMPFVEGESLRARLATCSTTVPLPLGESVAVLRDVVRALAYAHAHGVVHRDIKPENILLSGGAAVVIDFGIAKALRASITQPPGGTLTVIGTSLGTPAYMAPEQAVGDSADERSDIYAWGVVAYELLAGVHPFAASLTAQQLIAAHIAERPRELNELCATLPTALSSLVMRCLEKEPAARPQSAAEVLRVLEAPTLIGTTAATSLNPSSTSSPRSRLHWAPRWTGQNVAAAVIGLVVLAGSTAGRRRIAGALHLPGYAPSTTEGRASLAGAPLGVRLAVLPFENLGDTANAYFADGVADQVRGKLTGVPGLAVIARTSSVAYRGTHKSQQQIARELGVHYLLMGTVRWAKGANGSSRVQVNPELVELSDSNAPASKWQQPFDASLTDVFTVQTEIATQVANALDIALGLGARRELAERPTENLAAYDAYLRGGSILDAIASADATTLRRAAAYYKQATVLDSKFALAWARLSVMESRLYVNGAPTPEAAEIARIATERARALAPQGGDTYMALGSYHGRVLNDNALALQDFTTGLRVAPANGELLEATALVEQTLGRWESSLTHARRAALLDPRSANVARRLGNTLLWLRQYPEALAAYDRGLVLAPTSSSLLEETAMANIARGDQAGARAIVARPPREADLTEFVASVANYWDMYWILDDSEQLLLLQLSPVPFDNNRGTWGLTLAETYAFRGDTVRSRAYADSSRAAFEQQLQATPNDAQLHIQRGLALAYLGRASAAVKEGERGVALKPFSKDAYFGAYYQHQLVRIYLLVGQPERALDRLEPLLKIPYYLSPGWLRIDPTFASLKGNPRFERIADGHN